MRRVHKIGLLTAGEWFFIACAVSLLWQGPTLWAYGLASIAVGLAFPLSLWRHSLTLELGRRSRPNLANADADVREAFAKADAIFAIARLNTAEAQKALYGMAETLLAVTMRARDLAAENVRLTEIATRIDDIAALAGNGNGQAQRAPAARRPSDYQAAPGPCPQPLDGELEGRIDPPLMGIVPPRRRRRDSAMAPPEQEPSIVVNDSTVGEAPVHGERLLSDIAATFKQEESKS